MRQDGSGGERDLYGQLVLLFRDPIQVAFYLVAVAAVAVHGWVGWGKTVRKSDVAMDKTTRNAVVAAGRWGVVIPVCVAFASSTVYFAQL